MKNIQEIGKAMVIKARIVNRFRKDNPEADNIRKFPFYSEFYGMIQMLRLLGVGFDIEWNEKDVYMMEALVINGKRFAI